MESNKKACLKLTLVGVLIIILVSILLSINEYNKNKTSNIVRKSLLNYSKKCIIDNLCSDTVTIKELRDKNYIDKDNIELINLYEDDSYVIYSLREVYLKEKTS